jgi:RNA polymerase sigma-70 factor, ECF subfamily
LAKPSTKEFETLFRAYFKPLVGFSTKYVGDVDDAKGIVHDVYVNLWEKFSSLPSDTNLRSYLYTAVKNRSLNHVRDRKKHVVLSEASENIHTEENKAFGTQELETEIELGIAGLPDKCRQVFEMSRMEGLRYSQIAERMNISVKTVEAQMTKAMSHLRLHLKEFLAILFLLIE